MLKISRFAEVDGKNGLLSEIELIERGKCCTVLCALQIWPPCRHFPRIGPSVTRYSCAGHRSCRASLMQMKSFQALSLLRRYRRSGGDFTSVVSAPRVALSESHRTLSTTWCSQSSVMIWSCVADINRWIFEEKPRFQGLATLGSSGRRWIRRGENLGLLWNLNFKCFNSDSIQYNRERTAAERGCGSYCFRCFSDWRLGLDGSCQPPLDPTRMIRRCRVDLEFVMHILVIGGAGWWGACSYPLFWAELQVRVMDNLIWWPVSFLALWTRILNSADVRDARHGISAARCRPLDSLAAIVGYPACKNTRNWRMVNFEATNFCAKRTKDIPILFGSTGSNYGAIVGEICTEETPLNPVSLYGETKRSREAAAGQW